MKTKSVAGQREISAKRDERLEKAGQEMHANTMSRKQGARSGAEGGNTDEDEAMMRKS
jgi:hypothetical protein